MSVKHKKIRILKKLATELKTPTSLLQSYIQRQATHGIYADEENLYLNAIHKSLEILTSVTEELETLIQEFEEKGSAEFNDLQINPASCKTILIIDNDAKTRLEWRNAFRGQGARIIEAPSGESLLSMGLDYNQIHMAIVNYEFENSDLDGLDVVEYLKRKKIEQVHLCAAGIDDKEVHQKALLLGANSILPKPLSAEEITQIFKE